MRQGVGAVLAKLKNLGDFLDRLEAYGPLSGLILKPKKCVLVLLSVAANVATYL